MTSFQMDAMLKSIRVKREGGRLLISGHAIVDGRTADKNEVGLLMTRVGGGVDG